MTKEALTLALEALETLMIERGSIYDKAITAIKEALPQPELCKYGQEPKSCTSNPMDCQCVIDAALEQPEQEPVAYWDGESRFVSQKTKEWDKRTGGTLGFGCDIALYTTPPQRTWVGLTPDEIRGISLASGESLFSAIMFTHDKLKEKNT